MCPKCREEVTSTHKCTRCGKDITIEDSFVNPNFDIDKYNRLAGITNEDEEDDSYEGSDDIEELDDDEFFCDEDEL